MPARKSTAGAEAQRHQSADDAPPLLKRYDEFLRWASYQRFCRWTGADALLLRPGLASALKEAKKALPRSTQILARQRFTGCGVFVSRLRR
jgi:hypothetical protein